jgi:hypothetical protein
MSEVSPPPVRRRIADDLCLHGFAFCGGGVLRPGARRSGELRAVWEDLPRDPYLDADQGLRRRRFGRFSFDVTGAPPVLRALPPEPYRQTREQNRLFGDLDRWFAPLPEGLAFRGWLEGLVHLDFSVVRAVLADVEPRWVVGVHLIRIEALPEVPGLPTPEGLHQDGELFTFCHLVRRVGVEGGHWLVEPLPSGARRCIENRDYLDTLVVHDPRVRHGVTELCSAGPGPGYRDVLLIDFDPERPMESPC